MRRWSLAELEPYWRDLESLADQTSHADPWCSAPDWLFPVHDAFAPEAEPLLFGDPTEGMALLARYETSETRTISGLEPLWGFASPAVGPDHFDVLVSAFEIMSDDPDWSHAVLPAIPMDKEMIIGLASRLAAFGEVALAEGITSQIVDLSEGPQPWWARRSRRFRNQLHKATVQAAESGVQYDTVTSSVGLFERLLDIEANSWKGKAQDGITSPAMGQFYRTMIDRLGSRSRIQATIAVKDGLDVGFIVGGVRNGRYRGLQLSYVEEVRELSLGHILQLYEIQRLRAEVGVHTYDLGMDMEYKRRWADYPSSSATLVIRRS